MKAEALPVGVRTPTSEPVGVYTLRDGAEVTLRAGAGHYDRVGHRERERGKQAQPRPTPWTKRQAAPQDL